MSNRYIIKFNHGAVEMTKPNSTMLIYKIPYKNLEAGVGLSSFIDEQRNKAKIENGKLIEDVGDLKTPSGCGEFIMGAACNGWKYWKNEKGETIDKYRQS